MSAIPQSLAAPARSRPFLDEVPAAARAIIGLAELAFLALMVVFTRGVAPLTIRHRAVLAVFAISLPVAAWMVSRARASIGARLWLLLGSGFVLSLCVPKQNLQRPPGMPAAACVMVMGAAGILAALLLRRRELRTGFEAGLAAAALGIAAILLALFPSVSAQNSLDPEVLHNTLGELLDYVLLACGVGVLSSQRGACIRAAIVLALACLVRIAWHHGGG